MRLCILIPLLPLMVSTAFSQVPKVFDGLLPEGKPIKGEIGMVMPPKEIEKYMAKVEAAARKNREWYLEHSKNSKPGVPLPYDERLGLTQTEYDEYLALWRKREFKASEEIVLVLNPGDSGWSITAGGSAAAISTLRYRPETDSFESPSGVLKRIDDIKADPDSILGAWSGSEWKFEEQSEISKFRENIAIGRFADQPYGLIVYRAQEMSTEGTRLLDKSVVIRIPLQPKPPAKPAPAKKGAKR
jgi:hypothetical protein